MRQKILIIVCAIVLCLSFDLGFSYSKEEASWQESLFTQVNIDEINCLESGRDQNTVYVGTQKGVFKTSDNGKTWQNIFIASWQDDKNVLSLALDPIGKNTLIGTQGGLYIGKIGSNIWEKVKGGLIGEKITAVILSKTDPSIVYVASNKGIFKSEDSALTWQRIYVAKDVIESGDLEVESDNGGDSDEEKIENPINAMLLLGNNLLVGTDSGVFFYDVVNFSHEANPISGLAGENIVSLAESDKKGIIYIATENEIFQYELSKDKLERLDLGIDFQAIKDVELFAKGKDLYVLDASEIYTISAAKTFAIKSAYAQGSARPESINDEPSIQEVQNAAIDYAEVTPEKINSWRKGAKLRSLMPELGIGYDKTVTTALGASYDRVQVGPRDWSVDLSWDLADLVWNPYQKDIDVRSRLMVQLRNDILEDVTRIYFERLKLKNELRDKSNEGADRGSLELRIQELTAKIDALTGGYFSGRINSVKR